MAAKALPESAVTTYLRSLFGGDFTELEDTISIGVAPTRLVGSDPEAVSLVAVNLGSNDAYLRPSPDPSVSAGLLIAANGGNMSVNVRDDFTLPGKEWYGIAVNAAVNVYYIRLRRYIVLPPG